MGNNTRHVTEFEVIFNCGSYDEFIICYSRGASEVPSIAKRWLETKCGKAVASIASLVKYEPIRAVYIQ